MNEERTTLRYPLAYRLGAWVCRRLGSKDPRAYVVKWPSGLTVAYLGYDSDVHDLPQSFWDLTTPKKICKVRQRWSNEFFPLS